MTEEISVETAIREAIASAKSPSEVSQSPSAEPQNAQPEQPVATPEETKGEGETSTGDTFLAPEEKAEEAKATEEEKSVLKRWEAAYTKKRQQEVAELKALRQELEEAKKHVTNQSNRESGQPQTQKPISQMTPEEFANYTQEQTLKRFEEMQNEKQVEASLAYQNKMIEFFQAGGADSRLNKDGPKFDIHMASSVGQAVNAELDSYINEHGTAIGFPYQQVMKDKVAEYDSYLAALLAERQASSAQSESARVAKLAKSNPVGSMGKTDQADKSIEDVIREEISKRR